MAKRKKLALHHTIPARSGKAVRVRAGQVVKIINTHGYQVVDFWAFSARNSREFMSMEHTRPIIRKLTPVPGDTLITNKRRSMLKVLKDTTPGVHDTTVAACCPARYKQLGVKGYHQSCQENLHLALQALKRTPPESPLPFQPVSELAVPSQARTRIQTHRQPGRSIHQLQSLDGLHRGVLGLPDGCRTD